jgi:hypothetical protein
LALALFAITLFVSAFILFLVQPIIGKTILPKLGGTPQVWNTCMVFFQSVLLLGYFYTHASSTRLSQRRQLILHCLLLFVPFLILLPNGPFNITNWVPTLGANPLVSTLVLLFAVVGIPFFVVSTSAPLLQKWFGSTGHPAARDPYFLYGASNLGSMLALVLYPVLIEPFMDLSPQKWLWTASYGVLVILVLACAAMIWKPAGQMRPKLAYDGPPLEPSSEGQPVPPPAPVLETAPTGAGPATATSPAPSVSAVTASEGRPTTPKTTAFKKGKPQPRPHFTHAPAATVSVAVPSDEMTTWRRLRWIGLAAVPSSMMLGVTTHITTDLSPIPLFWLIPLTIYLLSFILVFSKWPVIWTEAPHTFMLYLQPALICLMIFMDIVGPTMHGNAAMFVPIVFNVLAFSATALVCHGELAKDRPSTKHLTEFYLLMSVGGMLGGIFNGIIAPVAFIYVWEFPIAVICACLLRPRMQVRGWADDMVAGLIEQPSTPAPAPKSGKGAHAPRPVVQAGAAESTTRAMDVVLPIACVVLALVLWLVAGPKRGDSEAAYGFKTFLVYGVPLTIAAFYYGRPLRFGLAVAGIMIFHAALSSRGDSSLYADRSYFGILRVKFGHGEDPPNETEVSYTQLIHGHINHGMNIFKPDNRVDWGKSDKDFSRLPTTYYHRYGPAGIVMQKYDWFPQDWLQGKPNSFHADARMPVSLIGQAALPLGTSTFPIGQLVALWSEPAYATIGLGTGTMACYGRPYQHVHYYEIDNHVRRMSLPLSKNQYYFTYYNRGKTGDNGVPGLPEELPFTFKDYQGSKPRTYFNSLKDAILRGSEVQVLMGDARLRMDLPYQNFHAKDAKGEPLEFSPVPPGGPRNFYHMMVVDAFSSDAIPVHLITKQAIQMYFEHLTEEGILCVHTSNRYVDLPLVVAAVANDLGYAYLRGHDSTPLRDSSKKRGVKAPTKELGRFTSEWVMVAKKAEYLSRLVDPPGYAEELRGAEMDPDDRRNFYWSSPTSFRKYLWTDDHSNLWNVIR